MITTGLTHSPAAQTEDQEIKYETKEDHSTLSRDDFMKLFVTQLQYQDPMNPMESAEMASQVAQFNMVDLMYKNNTALEGMANALNTSTSVSAISLIGHNVEYKGNELYVGSNGPEPFYLQIPAQGMSGCKITIKDASGIPVKTIEMNAAEPGTRLTLDWDGTDTQGDAVPEGTYHVAVEAKDFNLNDINLETWTTGRVSGIDSSEDGLPMIQIEEGPLLKFNEIKSVQD